MYELLTFPDHIRRTIMAFLRRGDVATAEMIADDTGRARAVESAYLNQLVLMGYLTKERRGRQVIFRKSETQSSEFRSLCTRICNLSRGERAILSEDLMTALSNRLTVFERSRSF